MHNITFLHEKITWYGRKRKELFERSLPEKWAEVDSSFFFLIAKYFFGNSKTENFIIEWAKLPDKVTNGLKRYMHLDIVSLLDSLLTRPVSNTVYVKKISIPGEGKEPIILRRLEGCMSDMTFAEFVDSECFLRTYNESKDQRNLLGLAAVLYRNQSIEKYDQRFVESRIEILKSASPDDIKAVHLNFICFLNWLADEYPMLYVKPETNEDGEEIPELQEPTAPPDYINLVYNLAGPKLGTVDQIEQMPVGYVFWLLCRRD